MTCGVGTQIKTKKCKGIFGGCEEVTETEKECIMQECPPGKCIM